MFQDPATLGITGVLCVTATIMSMHQVSQVTLVSRGAARAARRASTRPLDPVESDDETFALTFSAFSALRRRSRRRRPTAHSELTNESDDDTPHVSISMNERADLDAPVPVHAARAPAVHHPSCSWSPARLGSWISPLDRSAGIYLDTLRDRYESWVIYNFLALCLAYVGGAGNVANRADGREVLPSWLTGTCCLPPTPVDGAYVRACKRGALQFVIVEPALAALTLILVWAGVYGDQEIRGDVAYPYIAFVYNVSYTAALYALLLFYSARATCSSRSTRAEVRAREVGHLPHLLAEHPVRGAGEPRRAAGRRGRPRAAERAHLLRDDRSPCMMLYAFPSAPYVSETGVGALGVLRGAAHAIAVDDVVSDTVHQFAPTYQEYVLHGSEGRAAQDSHEDARHDGPGDGDARK